jgi:hypothetical protein
MINGTDKLRREKSFWVEVGFNGGESMPRFGTWSEKKDPQGCVSYAGIGKGVISDKEMT